MAFSFLTESDEIIKVMHVEQLQAGRNMATSLKQSSPLPPYSESPSSAPPCCGSGCAVCVLDYWEPNEFEDPAQEPCAANSDCGHKNHPRNNINEQTQTNSRTVDPIELPDNRPSCCGTGCAVCVLDYPELYSKQATDSETLLMLEAIEQAQWQARRILADQDGDSQ